MARTQMPAAGTIDLKDRASRLTQHHAPLIIEQVSKVVFHLLQPDRRRERGPLLGHFRQ